MKNFSKCSHTNQQKTTKISRNAWIELLRFIAITWICVYHYFKTNTPYIIQAQCGVIIFTLISGFFGIKTTKTRLWKTFVKFAIWTFYGLLIYIILYWAGPEKTEAQNPIAYFFSFKFLDAKYTSWWYIYVYFVIVVIQPYLNKFIQSIEKFTGLFVIIIAAILAEFWNLHGGWEDAWSYLSPWMIFYVIVYYLTGAWISFHYSNKFTSSNNQKILYISAFFSLISICYFLLLGQIANFLNSKSVTTNYFTTLFQFICGISLLIFFSCLPPIKYHWLEKTIKFAGWISLGIYLMHAPCFIVLDLIWPTNGNNAVVYFVGRFIVYYFIVAIPIAAFMTKFISIQENFFWKKWNAYKLSKKQTI